MMADGRGGLPVEGAHLVMELSPRLAERGRQSGCDEDRAACAVIDASETTDGQRRQDAGVVDAGRDSHQQASFTAGTVADDDELSADLSHGF